MRRLSRRRLLALGGAGLAGGLSGCSTGSNSDTARPGGGGNGGNGGDTATPTPSATTSPGPELRYPAFAERTARIADGIVWHATRWDPTMGEVRSHANRVVSAVLSMQEADTITASDIDALEERTTEMATYLREAVVPHYTVPDEAVLTGDNVLVQQLRIASQRGDTESQRSQLRQITSLYEKYTQSYFLENAFPNGPIQAKLFGDLAAGEGTSAVFGVFHPASRFVETVTSETSTPTASDDGVPQHTHEFPSGHVVVAHAHPHGGTHDLGQHENEPVTRQLYAYRNGQFDILQDTNAELPNLTAFEPHLIDVFRSVSVPDRREDVVYASVNDPVADFVALPLQIQQFDSAATAAEAVDFLLTSDISQEGTTSVAGREWRRIFYTQQGTNIYAFLLQTGSCVITLFPEPVAWGERVDWPGPFGTTWVVGGDGAN
jgi:hypothetical protein